MSHKLTEKKRGSSIVVASSRWQLVISVLALGLAGYLVLGSREMWQMDDKKNGLADLEARVERLQTERDSLKNVLWRLENDLEYVEKVAREEYGMSKKGERVYTLPADGSD
jgi:cell division protein FtsB